VSWLEAAAIIFGLLGFAAMGAVLALRLYHNPFLLSGLIPVLWAHVKPALVKHVLPYFGRMEKADEDKMRDENRAGRGDEWLKEWHQRRHKRKGRE
jgi:hypothetical protein